MDLGGCAGPVWAGVDTHKDTHALCVIDDRGAQLLSAEFPATPAGIDALAAAIGDPGACALVAVEGCGSYGARLASRLSELGYAVAEASRPKKEPRDRRGKSDPVDAARAAELARAGGCAPVKLSDPDLDELSLLFARREMLVRHRTAVYNQVDGELARAPEAVRARLGGLSGAARMEALAACRPRPGSEAARWLGQLRESARLWRGLREGADAAEARMREIVERRWPRMLTLVGVDVLTAAPLVLLGGANPGRFGSEAAFAKACGAAPIPAGSGRRGDRHRLDRGGDRQANRALTTVARCRLEHDGRTRAYAERRRAERRPRTDREIVRCLKRYIAREVYAVLLDPSMPPHPGPSLAEARRALGVTQARAASDLGTSVARISMFENRKKRYGWLEPLYLGYVEALCLEAGVPFEIGGLQT